VPVRAARIPNAMARPFVSRCGWHGVAVLMMMLAPFRAQAQSDTESALAEALYRQARELMAQAKYAEACPKLAESYRLDPGTGTLLNLATCRELEGKLATAWLLYSDALLAAQRDRRDDREQFAREHLSELEPKLSRLTLVVPPEADTPDLDLTLDGARIAAASRGVPTYVDPGSHNVQAKAPGKLAWSQTIEIGATAEQRVISIPKLEAALPEQPAPAAKPAVPAQPQPVAPPSLAKTWPTPRVVYVAGGVTAALAVAATVTGIIYLDKRSTYHSYLVSHDNAPSSDAASLRDSARLNGDLNAALWIATACGAASTLYLYLARPERLELGTAPSRARTTPRVAPVLAPGYAGLGVSGGF
jgi:tetratricopeptide (TPR) repeat protein